MDLNGNSVSPPETFNENYICSVELLGAIEIGLKDEHVAKSSIAHSPDLIIKSSKD